VHFSPIKENFISLQHSTALFITILRLACNCYRMYKRRRMKSDITGTASIVIDAPAEKVWEALTNPELIKQYFFGTDAISDWKEGSPLLFKGTWQGKTYEDKGTILTVKQNELFRYSYWSSMSGIEDKPENYVTVSYILIPNGDRTKLEITQENIPDEKMKAHSEENWNKVLEGLKGVVEAKQVAYL
jgi:uncharacterized protein YndB with AHSA1/START domain